MLGGLLLAGCQTASPLPFAPGAQFQSPVQIQSASHSTRQDWFTQLRPDLQTYYAPARGKTGQELFNTLNQIVANGHKPSDYNTAKSYMYAVADQVKVNNRSGLFDAYSYAFIPGTGGNGNSYKESTDENGDGSAGDFINCEHTWPQSFFNKVPPMVSDLHHLFPTLSVPNAIRGNYPIGMATGGVPYTTNGGAKLGLLDKTGKPRPLEELKKIMRLPYEQRDPILDREFHVTFEPPDRQKGNTARALLYFYLRYHNQDIRRGEYNQERYWISKVPTFLQWAEQVDQPDAAELKRHELAFQFQKNRNPFIDIPNLGSLIGAEVLQRN